jgi:hypothetical protein
MLLRPSPIACSLLLDRRYARCAKTRPTARRNQAAALANTHKQVKSSPALSNPALMPPRASSAPLAAPAPHLRPSAQPILQACARCAAFAPAARPAHTHRLSHNAQAQYANSSLARASFASSRNRSAASPAGKCAQLHARLLACTAAVLLSHALTQHPGLQGLRSASCAPHYFHLAAARATHNSAPLPAKVRPCANCPLRRSVQNCAHLPSSCSPDITGTSEQLLNIAQARAPLVLQRTLLLSPAAAASAAHRRQVAPARSRCSEQRSRALR